VTTVGRRIRLVTTTDPHTDLHPGSTGTVNSVDYAGTLHVRWDGGSTLGLVPDQDHWELLPVPRTYRCPACGQEAGLRIVWGLPDPDLFAAAERGEVVAGGCLKEDFDRQCQACSHQWKAGR